MVKTNNNAGYNARNPYMPIWFSRIVRASGSLLLVLLHVTFLSAMDWKASEQEMAGKIASVTGPGAVALEVTNRCSLGHTDVDQIHRGLLTELATLGVRAVNPDQAAATVQISLSEDLQHYVWVAEIHQGLNQNSVVMVSMSRSPKSRETTQAAAMTIHKSFLWSQSTRILDIGMVSGNPQHIVVLDANAVTIYSSQGGHWQEEQKLAIEHSHPWPRDLRGRLVLRKDHLFDAFLPGVFCRSTTTAPLAMNCYASDDPWLLIPGMSDQPALNAFFASTRNFFVGALSPGVGKQTATSAFYSAAALPRDKYILWLFSTVDGNIRFLDGATDRAAPQIHWGSDIAGIHSSCGSGWQVLASGIADSTNDIVQAYEVPDREPVAVSAPIEFSGNVTALWTSSEGNGAVAVLHNVETGIYEAFLLTITCNQ
jgi:hypothetical protein